MRTTPRPVWSSDRRRRNAGKETAAQDITGKTAIITGASSGTGRACALALAREEVHLVLTARSEDRLADITQQCRELGVPAAYHAGDAREESTAAETVRLAVEAFGGSTSS